LKVVKYACRSASVWEIETVVDFSSSSTNLGQATSLGLGLNDQPHIAYYEDVGIGIVRHATRTLAAAALAVAPGSLDFGQVPVGEISSMSVLVQNIGGQTLDVTDILVDDAAFSVTPPTSFSLAALDTHRVYVEFSSPDTGLYTGNLTFMSNDPLAPSVSLTGEAVSVTGVGEGDQLPAKTELLQSYPNPFNPSTNIVYRVDSQQSIVLTVHDVLGQEIATLVNEVKRSGTYTATWDATGFASGVYYYRLTAGSYIETRKLVVAK
jgi:hypothetical protein